MKPILRRTRPLLLAAAATLALLLVPKESKADFGAFAYSNGPGSFGAYGLSWNWRTPNAAVNAAAASARRNNGGFLDGYRFAWWGNRGWSAGARGYDYYGDFVRFGWARGWRTRNGAANFAINRLGWETYGLGWVAAFNR
jgi:hypothetical protein